MKFKIAIVQIDIVWEDIAANLNQLSQLFKDVDSDTDLIVLPEMFATGFSMNTDFVSENMEGSVVSWLKQKAAVTGAAIIGTHAIKERNSIYNRALFSTPDGLIQYYNKRHLFSPGDEHLNYTKGLDRKVFKYKGVRILPQICYDLRFPIWSRNRNDYDLAIYMANWPAARQKVWDVLIKARAIENQCYVCAVNRVGEGDGIEYVGGSQLIDFKGSEQLNLGQCVNKITYSNIDISSLQAFKDRFPSYKDADGFELKGE